MDPIPVKTLHKFSLSLKKELLSYRHHLHQHPELSFTEFQTQSYLKNILTSLKVEDIRETADTGLLALVTGQSTNGPSILLRADMDALPIVEKNKVPYASRNKGVMHACGHDVHMTCLLGALQILQYFDQWDGKVFLLFQPGEEKFPGGAIQVLDSGIIDQIDPLVIIGQHVEPTMETGFVGYRAGKYMASSDEIYLTISGKGGHAALPSQTANTTLAAAEIITQINEAIGKNQPTDMPTIIAFGKIIAEGATNVIPDKVKAEGTFRTMGEGWRRKAHPLIRNTARTVAEKYGVKCQVVINVGYPVLKNHPSAVSLASHFSARYLGPNQVISLDTRMTSEDFAYYSQRFPSLFFRLGVKKPGTRNIRKLHTPLFNIDEAALTLGSGHLAWLVLNFLKKHDRLGDHTGQDDLF